MGEVKLFENLSIVCTKFVIDWAALSTSSFRTFKGSESTPEKSLLLLTFVRVVLCIWLWWPRPFSSWHYILSSSFICSSRWAPTVITNIHSRLLMLENKILRLWGLSIASSWTLTWGCSWAVDLVLKYQIAVIRCLSETPTAQILTWCALQLIAMVHAKAVIRSAILAFEADPV